MPNKTLTITLTGPEETLDPAIIAYAEASGWTTKVMQIVDDVQTEVDNPITAVQAAREPLRQHLMQTVQARFIQQAQKEAMQAASQAASGAMDTISMTLELGDAQNEG